MMVTRFADGSSVTEPVPCRSLAEVFAIRNDLKEMLSALRPERRAVILAEHPSLAKQPEVFFDASFTAEGVAALDDESNPDREVFGIMPPFNVAYDTPVVGDVIVDGVRPKFKYGFAGVLPLSFGERWGAALQARGHRGLVLIPSLAKLRNLRHVVRESGDDTSRGEDAAMRAQIEAVLNDSSRDERDRTAMIEIPNVVDLSPFADENPKLNIGRIANLSVQLLALWIGSAAEQAEARDFDSAVIRTPRDGVRGGLAKKLLESARLQAQRTGESLDAALAFWRKHLPARREVPLAEVRARLSEPLAIAPPPNPMAGAEAEMRAMRAELQDLRKLVAANAVTTTTSATTEATSEATE